MSQKISESIPDSLKIMKTAVAFSNGAGGKLIIGVKDKAFEETGLFFKVTIYNSEKDNNVF